MFHEGSASKENMASLRRDTKHSLAEAEHQTLPRRGKTQKHGLAEAKHDKGRMAQKLRETLIQNIMRLLESFHRFKSS